jgi:hypothetical protein
LVLALLVMWWSCGTQVQRTHFHNFKLDCTSTAVQPTDSVLLLPLLLQVQRTHFNDFMLDIHSSRGFGALLILLLLLLLLLLLPPPLPLLLLLALQVQRTHFHDFMLDIHSRLRHTKGEADPLRHVADDVAAGIKVRVWCGCKAFSCRKYLMSPTKQLCCQGCVLFAAIWCGSSMR